MYARASVACCRPHTTAKAAYALRTSSRGRQHYSTRNVSFHSRSSNTAGRVDGRTVSPVAAQRGTASAPQKASAAAQRSARAAVRRVTGAWHAAGNNFLRAADATTLYDVDATVSLAAGVAQAVVCAFADHFTPLQILLPSWIALVAGLCMHLQSECGGERRGSVAPAAEAMWAWNLGYLLTCVILPAQAGTATVTRMLFTACALRTGMVAAWYAALTTIISTLVSWIAGALPLHRLPLDWQYALFDLTEQDPDDFAPPATIWQPSPWHSSSSSCSRDHVAEMGMFAEGLEDPADARKAFDSMEEAGQYMSRPPCHVFPEWSDCSDDESDVRWRRVRYRAGRGPVI